ncbi:MAG: peptide ABC transporter substrate-binding protein [Chloroflexi bacterium]|nr:peptide ABC transporter substrate-binding protein [Chloroflexota bacterium]MCI0578621.1 peptide ABC transporter substrate-binding protein [Chloroflexota bacterium]MCI0647380.1 peptide ABC transporter substrate-binding protein [Chloroflexota bacterium]MCI0727840.1 peptide ABC transporter substrate-binding protein [Chloroflexota bacterium]
MVTRNLRWQALLAIICLGLVFSLLSFQVQTAGLCTTQVPASGGTLVEGMVGLPSYLNPLLADANPVDQDLSSLIFDGLTRYDASGQLAPALARSWEISDDGRTFRFTLRDDVTWHDGRPLTAADVAFTYGLLQNEAFPAPAGLRALWQPVTISVTNELEIAFTLPQPYTPFLDATTRGILPAHVLGDSAPERLAEHPFNRSPTGTGPFLVEPGSDWQRSGALRLAANPTYWRQGVQLDSLEFRFYPDSQALARAFTAGEIQAVTTISPAALPELGALPGMRLFTAAAPRYTLLFFNLTDSGLAVPALEVRQGLAYALDRDALVDQALNGQGLPLEGPYLPTSWAYNPALLATYPYQPETAVSLLETAGWRLPAGQTVRQQGGETLALRLLVPEGPVFQALAGALVEQWAAVGVVATPQSLPPAGLQEALLAREYDVALVDVEPPGDPDLYDFWSQEAIIDGQNVAGWNHRRASEALEVARQLPTVDERQPYYEAFLRFYNNDLPALTLYQHVYTYGLSEAVNQADIGRIYQPRDRYETLANWFLLYRDVAVSCPEVSPTPVP